MISVPKGRETLRRRQSNPFPGESRAQIPTAAPSQNRKLNRAAAPISLPIAST